MPVTAQIAFDVEKVRKEFPLLQTSMNGKPIAFLDSAASSQKPHQVIDAITTYYREKNANVHRGVYQLSQEATTAFENARERARSFINAPASKEVIFVRGCTEGINLVASTFGKRFLKEGNEVLVSGMEHHSNIVPWQMACEDRGARLRVIPVNDRGELIMEEFERLLTDKVKIVAVTHVSNTLGTINPVAEIIAKAHEKGIPVLVDGAQAIPHMKVDVQELDADFYTFSGHKMFGPTGIGVLYGKEKWLNEMPPYQGGGEMIETVTFEKTTYNELPHKFEAGTPDIAGAVGLEAAIEYIQSIGYEAIHRHEAELLAYGAHQLQQIEGIRFIGTAREKASVISFLVEGIHPYDLGTILDKLGIAVRTGHHCTQPLMERFCIPGTVRASLAFYNNKNDIDRLVEGVRRAVAMLK
ncbi:MAG: cysteine desulfurase [Lewinellaceae bacterium]|nr:cysteine desulfurase [Phaeodactylibacter sp.]MCB0615340.1 cysteine desulfurase [Phaeodactylibacter sp.]MCB9348978.1 cysteine desulfurase [Lewinellaceae bacterium]